ncbi:MAG: hypothetical protein A2144_12770 [Chloroflexi bacterium RBG_16_50_9]|nr:MAG: hypothetical protein A2144_12770 [Chloroflexi bacterium RBG_16_50_9]
MKRNHIRLLLGAVLALMQLSGILTPAFTPVTHGAAIALSDAAPDLVIETISWSPSSPSIGDKVTFSVTVKNRGNSHAGSSSTACYIDDVHQTSATVAALAPGTTATIVFTWTAQAGSHIVKAVADNSNNVNESDEANNVRTFAFPVLSPDLIIENISWSPEEPSVRDLVTFTVTIKNQGNIKSGSCNINYFVDGSSRGYKPIQGIEAGASITETFTWTALPGPHDINAIADFLKQVKESDETNNSLTVTYATAAPDLIVKNITWTPDDPTENSAIDFTVTVENQGTGKAEHSTVTCYIDDNYETSLFIGQLNAGDSSSANFTWTGVPGTHVVRAVADSGNRIIESDETNNEKTAVPIALEPDLIIDSIILSPANPIVGSYADFNVSVTNRGSNKVGIFRVYLYIDDLKWQQDIVELDANTTVTIPFAWTADAFPHVVRAVADSEYIVSESDETNNERTINVGSFSGLTPADLIIQNVVWSPEIPSTGDRVSFTVTIMNQGKGEAGVFHVAYYVDGISLPLAYCEPVAAGKTTTKQFTWQAVPGEHNFRIVADADSVITETIETNNEMLVTLSLSSPDIVIPKITWSPLIPSTGDLVTFTVTVKNQGDVSASNSYVAYFIDGSPAGNHDVQTIGPGATATRTFSWTAQAGSHTIKVVADAEDQIVEGNERNNERIVNFPAPDLTVASITWSPEDPSEGDTVIFSVSVKNQGSGQANYAKLAFFIDGLPTGYTNIGEADAGATVTSTFSWRSQAGSHTIRAVADDEDYITESDESNNVKTVNLSVATLPVPALAPATTGGHSQAPAEITKGPEQGIVQNIPAGQDKAPASKQSSTSLSMKDQLLKWWLIIGAVILVGIALFVKLKFRQQARNQGQVLNR